MANSTRIAYLYALYEVGKENEIRYVGKSNNPKNRFRCHRNEKSNNKKSSWMKSVYKRGGEVKYKVLKVVQHEKWEEEEIKLIDEYIKNGFNLKNDDIGGKGGKLKYNRSYEECKEWIKNNKPNWVENQKDYDRWLKEFDLPDFLPIAPSRVFDDFKWFDYLDNILIKKDRFLSYEDAKKWIKENYNFKSSSEYRKTDLPYFIPTKPYNKYRNEWVSWNEFLDFKPFKRDKNNIYYTFEDAKKWIKENLNNITAYKFRELSKNGYIPEFIPSKPERTYKNEWIGWYDWLGKIKKKSVN